MADERDGFREVTLSVNGETHRLRVHPLDRLLDVLRDGLGLTGTKEGCGEGECGACTTLVDGEAVNACLVPMCQVDGAAVLTVEGPGLETLREAFLDEEGAQCGICTPGMILAARAHLDDCAGRGVSVDPENTRRALAGNLCRCTGYEKIIGSVMAAVREKER